MAQPSSDKPPHPRHHHVPPGTGTFGMALFLIALGMLFAASLLGYLLIRFRPEQPPVGTIHLPDLFWLSTLVILASSFTAHAALKNVRHERQTPFRRAIMLTLGLAVLFLIVQAPSLVELLSQHHAQTRQQTNLHLYGLTFFLILVHALHLLGGLVPLAIVAYKANAGRYDHEHYAPVKYLAMYWHFLDAVWLIMFLTFLLTA